MTEKMYSGPVRETPETISKDVENSFDGLDLRDVGAVDKKKKELEDGGYTGLVVFLEKMHKRFLELTQKKE